MEDDVTPRTGTAQLFERAAERLVVYQLDLLAQIESQLRTAHHTMRRIERLRAAKYRPDLTPVTNGERELALGGLADELGDLNDHIASEMECTRQMQDTIDQMQRWLLELRRAAALIEARNRASEQRADTPASVRSAATSHQTSRKHR